MADTNETHLTQDNNKIQQIELKIFNVSMNDNLNDVTNSTSLLNNDNDDDNNNNHILRNHVATRSHLSSNPFNYILNLLQNNYAILFLLFICGLPVLIKLFPVHSNDSFKKTKSESPQFLKQDLISTNNQSSSNNMPYKNNILDILPTISSTYKIALENPVTQLTSTTTTMTTTSTNSIDPLLVNILQRLKDERMRKSLIKDSFRLKSLCSNSYLTVRKGSVHARSDEDKAFESKYAEIETLRLGNYVALRNDHLNMYICYDSNGILKPVEPENLSELCIFKQQFSEYHPYYREFISIAKKFKDSSIQFRMNGGILKAEYSILIDSLAIQSSTDIFHKILNNRSACPHLTGLLIHKSKLDIGLKSIENSIKQKSLEKFNLKYNKYSAIEIKSKSSKRKLSINIKKT